MKELTSYNRVAGYLNKVFDLLNAAFFENALSRPTITIQSTPRAYGHFSLREGYLDFQAGRHSRNQHRSRDAGPAHRGRGRDPASRNGTLLQLRERHTGLQPRQHLPQSPFQGRRRSSRVTGGAQRQIRVEPHKPL